jgi:hypothetical protein
MPYQKFLDVLRFKPLWREGPSLLELMLVDGHITHQGFSVTVVPTSITLFCLSESSMALGKSRILGALLGVKRVSSDSPLEIHVESVFHLLSTHTDCIYNIYFQDSLFIKVINIEGLKRKNHFQEVSADLILWAGIFWLNLKGYFYFFCLLNNYLNLNLPEPYKMIHNNQPFYKN